MTLFFEKTLTDGLALRKYRR